MHQYNNFSICQYSYILKPINTTCKKALYVTQVFDEKTVHIQGKPHDTNCCNFAVKNT